MSDIETFTQAYIDALYFTDTGDIEQPAFDTALASETKLDIEADCRSFWRRFGCYITTDTCSDAFDDSVSQAGHDFHMTRNGHGVGFWEDEWPKTYRNMLDNGAKAYGTFDIYQGDDGLIHA